MKTAIINIRTVMTAVWCAVVAGGACPHAAMAGERYVLDTNSGIGLFELNGGHLTEVVPLISYSHIYAPHLPSLRSSTDTFYFEAWPEHGPWIFEAPLDETASENYRPVVQGHAPSVSPDERHLAFVTYRQHDLAVLDLETGEQRVIDHRVVKWNQPLWLDQHRLLYRLDVRIDNEADTIPPDLVLYNLKTEKRQLLPFGGLYPAAKLPGQEKVICGRHRRKKIDLLDLEEQTVKPLVQEWFFSVRNRAVLRPDGQGFLYARQNLKNWLRLRPESVSIYSRDWGGNEHMIKDLSELGGGFNLDSADSESTQHQ